MDKFCIFGKTETGVNFVYLKTNIHLWFFGSSGVVFPTAGKLGASRMPRNQIQQSRKPALASSHLSTFTGLTFGYPVYQIACPDKVFYRLYLVGFSPVCVEQQSGKRWSSSGVCIPSLHSNAVFLEVDWCLLSFLPLKNSPTTYHQI